MNDKEKPKGYYRRGFIKGVGSGVVGSYMVVPVLSKISQKVFEEVEMEGTNKEPLTLKINGKKVNVLVEPRTTLAELLRDRFKLTGTKVVCNQGECGGCTVLMNGKAIFSCHLLAHDAGGTEITTIEGLISGEKLHPIKEEILDGMSGNLCRCAAYPNILKSVVAAAEKNK